jgi:FtsP/CotA-like multicopper oxidase with cupredoxin domain
MNVQHPQVQQDGKPLTEFIKEGELNLIPGEAYDLRCMAVTSDNKLLLCNYHYNSFHMKVYIYKDYKTMSISLIADDMS